ncbi:hypothetical protein J21TS7_43560 [Paenibacillus cineris]|uniref:Uncharacterized protein n=1 Tax=Paenibacillus cineris TaxID=237530 RepID=A0ABQ4LJ96_9BACL|nr:hypothetical protein J21TS7_43560 [Paenibacillus cineris]
MLAESTATNGWVCGRALVPDLCFWEGDVKLRIHYTGKILRMTMRVCKLFVSVPMILVNSTVRET